MAVSLSFWWAYELSLRQKVMHLPAEFMLEWCCWSLESVFSVISSCLEAEGRQLLLFESVWRQHK